MSKNAVSQIFAQLSVKDAQSLAKHRGRLVQLENEISDEILGIVYSLPTLNGSSALVVTPTRIIELTEGGSMQIHSYAELSGIRVGPGQKKLFGGYGESYLLLDTSTGTYTYPLYGDHERIVQAANAARSAFGSYRLRTT
jgi:hypothetical protein